MFFAIVSDEYHHDVLAHGSVASSCSWSAVSATTYAGSYSPPRSRLANSFTKTAHFTRSYAIAAITLANVTRVCMMINGFDLMKDLLNIMAFSSS